MNQLILFHILYESTDSIFKKRDIKPRFLIATSCYIITFSNGIDTNRASNAATNMIIP